jgi:hypothetical protein
MVNQWKRATTTTLGLIGLIIAIPPNSVFAASNAWVERYKINGDFRYRYEYFDEEGQPQSRHRNRLRLRLGIQAQVNDKVNVGMMLASGGEDPVSTNQSLDSQASTKDIRLDQGYFTFKPLDGLKIKGGKFKNPFYVPVKSELIWDVDIRPEGLVLQYDRDQIFTNLGFFYVEERSKEDDTLLFGGQVGYKTKVNDVKVTGGTSYFTYTNIEGYALDDFDYLKAEGDSFGNTLDDEDRFITEYQLWEVFGDVTIKMGGMPITLFGDYVINTAADEQDTGYTAGIKIGQTKNPGSWDFRYLYQKIEDDAVFGTFSDSDFVGGGTSGRGHEYNFGYQIAKGWKLAVSYFNNNKNLHNEHDYERAMVDLKFKF